VNWPLNRTVCSLFDSQSRRRARAERFQTFLGAGPKPMRFAFCVDRLFQNSRSKSTPEGGWQDTRRNPVRLPLPGAQMRFALGSHTPKGYIVGALVNARVSLCSAPSPGHVSNSCGLKVSPLEPLQFFSGQASAQDMHAYPDRVQERSKKVENQKALFQRSYSRRCSPIVRRSSRLRLLTNGKETVDATFGRRVEYFIRKPFSLGTL